MNDGSVMERHDHLPPEPSSASAARRMVEQVIAGSNLAGTTQADTAVLLVSEVVSNAVLHAGTPIRVSVRVDGDTVRVEVRDGSAVMPSVRHYQEGAATGRGMELVEILASAWGAYSEPTGKLVWFEVSTDPTAASETPSGTARPSGPMWTRVELRNLPASLLHASLEYGDAALRELALQSFTETHCVLPEISTAPRLDLGPLMAALDEAHAKGLTSIDVELEFPPSAEEAAVERLAAVEEAERLAAENCLLLLPAVPEIAHCRRWLMGEITLQLQGKAPTAWELPPLDDAPGEISPLDAALRERIDAEPRPIVVGDTSHHIVHANQAACELLGWGFADLIGRRITMIVPPTHRAAHLAGFTRYQLTGIGRLIGSSVEVPVLRRDDSALWVTLTIEVLDRGPQGRAFKASLLPIDPEP